MYLQSLSNIILQNDHIILTKCVLFRLLKSQVVKIEETFRNERLPLKYPKDKGYCLFSFEG